jgi:hypothetical protein
MPTILEIVLLAGLILLIVDSLSGRGSRESRRRIDALERRLAAVEQQLPSMLRLASAGDRPRDSEAAQTLLGASEKGTSQSFMAEPAAAPNRPRD